MDAVEEQEERIRKYKSAWSELEALANARDVSGFYERYAEFLESTPMISNERHLLHRMACLVVECHKKRHKSSELAYEKST